MEKFIQDQLGDPSAVHFGTLRKRICFKYQSCLANPSFFLHHKIPFRRSVVDRDFVSPLFNIVTNPYIKNDLLSFMLDFSFMRLSTNNWKSTCSDNLHCDKEHLIAHFQNCHALANPLKRHDQILAEVVKLAVGLKIRIDMPFDITKLDEMKFQTCTDDTRIKGLKIFQNKDPRNNVRSVNEMLESTGNQDSDQSSYEKQKETRSCH